MGGRSHLPVLCALTPLHARLSCAPASQCFNFPGCSLLLLTHSEPPWQRDNPSSEDIIIISPDSDNLSILQVRIGRVRRQA